MAYYYWADTNGRPARQGPPRDDEARHGEGYPSLTVYRNVDRIDPGDMVSLEITAENWTKVSADAAKVGFRSFIIMGDEVSRGGELEDLGKLFQGG